MHSNILIKFKKGKHICEAICALMGYSTNQTLIHLYLGQKGLFYVVIPIYDILRNSFSSFQILFGYKLSTLVRYLCQYNADS